MADGKNFAGTCSSDRVRRCSGKASCAGNGRTDLRNDGGKEDENDNRSFSGISFLSASYGAYNRYGGLFKYSRDPQH